MDYFLPNKVVEHLRFLYNDLGGDENVYMADLVELSCSKFPSISQNVQNNKDFILKEIDPQNHQKVSFHKFCYMFGKYLLSTPVRELSYKIFLLMNSRGFLTFEDMQDMLNSFNKDEDFVSLEEVQELVVAIDPLNNGKITPELFEKIAIYCGLDFRLSGFLSSDLSIEDSILKQKAQQQYDYKKRKDLAKNCQRSNSAIDLSSTFSKSTYKQRKLK
jgi:Ca2+-binding EF-hand superfamily protein